MAASSAPGKKKQTVQPFNHSFSFRVLVVQVRWRSGMDVNEPFLPAANDHEDAEARDLHGTSTCAACEQAGLHYLNDDDESRQDCAMRARHQNFATRCFEGVLQYYGPVPVGTGLQSASQTAYQCEHFQLPT